MRHFSPRRLAHQFLERRLKWGGRFRHDLTLRGRRQRDAQVLFQAFQSIPGKPASVPQHGHHGRRRLIVFLLARAFRSGGGEDLAAEMTAQLFQFIHRRRDRRLSLDPHQHTRIALRINLAVALRVRTRISRLQGLVRNLDLLRPAIRSRAVAPVPRGWRASSSMLLWCFAFLIAGLNTRLFQHRLGLLRAGRAQ